MSFGLGLIFFMAGSCTNSWWTKIRWAKRPKNIAKQRARSTLRWNMWKRCFFRLPITSLGVLPMSPDIVRVLPNRRWYNLNPGSSKKEVLFQTFATCVPSSLGKLGGALCLKNWKNRQNWNVPGMRSNLRISLPTFPLFTGWNHHFWWFNPHPFFPSSPCSTCSPWLPFTGKRTKATGFWGKQHNFSLAQVRFQKGTTKIAL